MTEDWRKELGIETSDYKWQMDNKFKIPDEEFFVMEHGETKVLDFLKRAN